METDSDTENKLVVARGEVGGRMSEGGEEVQFSDYKTRKTWESSIQHKEYSH